MKAKDLLEKAEQEVQDEKSKYVLNKLKQSLRNVMAAEKTLRKVKESHEKLLETDVDDFEDMEY